MTMNGWILYFGIFLLTFVVVAQGLLEGFFCPGPQGEDKHKKCDLDCQANHGAAHGFCGDTDKGDFNCYCTLPRQQRYRMSPEVRKRLVMCKRRGRDARYDIACRIFCQCNHAALDGQCNYRTQACECLGGNQNPLENGTCPFDTPKQVFRFIDDLEIPNFPRLST